MRNKFIVISILFSIISCTNKKIIIEKIEFNNKYRFSSEIENKVKTDTIAWKYQISMTDYATKGDYQNALKHWGLAFRSKPKSYTKTQIDSINKKYKIVKATDYITEQANKNQIVIINEAHHNSSHRVFTKSLLQKLYDVGYKNLGFEALGNGAYLDSLLNKRKYPIQETGFYIKNPQFGNLVRDALSIGYHLFAYENTNNSDGKQREIEQAKNIQMMIKKKPNEKFIIHCGFDHVLEGNYPRWEKTMAGRLEEYTGINPFTINQTQYTEKSKSELNHPLLKSLNIKEPSILLDKNNIPYKYRRGKTWTDIAVFHPNTIYIDDRPNWLFKNGNKNIIVELKEIDILFPVMVLAFKKGENINNAVPIDIYEVKNKSINPHLALPKGKYEIVVVNKGNDAQKFELEVK